VKLVDAFSKLYSVVVDGEGLSSLSPDLCVLLRIVAPSFRAVGLHVITY
jgi:hypothetical protein